MYDLNFQIKSMHNQKDFDHLMSRALGMNWETIAWNQSHNTLNNTKNMNNKIIPTNIKELNGKKLKKALNNCQLSKNINKNHTTTTTTTTNNNNISNKTMNIEQINRITINVSDIMEAQSLTCTNSVLNSFDLVAVRTTDIKTFAYLCTQADGIDIITFDFTRSLGFPIDKKLLDEAIKRGIYFEICYSSLLKTAEDRKRVLSNTKVLLQYLRGKHVLLTSGANDYTLLRSPIDVVNIGHVLGMKHHDAFAAITTNPQACLFHGAYRKRHYGNIELRKKVNSKQTNMNNNNSNHNNYTDDEDEEDEEEEDDDEEEVGRRHQSSKRANVNMTTTSTSKNKTKKAKLDVFL